MQRHIDCKGKRFGKLTAVKFMGTDKHRNALWLCKCACGNTKVISRNSLKSGCTRSCGCIPTGRKKLDGRKRLY